MDIPRPRSSGRGRSSSRGRGTFRGGNARPLSRKRSDNNPIPLDKQPQKKESLESIEQYEKKKREDPEHKDISISQFFTEWIDLKRTNITGELNDFEGDIIKKYTDFLKNTLDLRKVPKDERTEITGSMKSGMILALSIRLLRTASNSQSQLDNEYHRLITEIEKFEIPSFYNTTLSNIGKFTDPTFGNFRLEYPLTKSKQKVVEAMILKSENLKDQYSFKPGKSRQDFNKWWESIIKGNPNLYIFDERDTVEYLKYQGERHFELFRSMNFKIQCKNKTINFSFPFFEFTLLTKETVGEYIKLITDMDSTFSEEIKNQRDKLIACLLFQLANSDFVENPDITISDWMPYFDGNFPVLADVKIRDLYDFMGLVFLGDFLDDRSLKHNAKIIYNDYMETAYPMMKKNFNMSELTNDAFGNTAQLIEVPYIDKNHYASERRDFKAITKLKDANLNVFGALFNYTKNLNFKRKIISTLSTTSDNILTTFTQKDLRYKINK